MTTSATSEKRANVQPKPSKDAELRRAKQLLRRAHAFGIDDNQGFDMDAAARLEGDIYGFLEGKVEPEADQLGHLLAALEKSADALESALPYTRGRDSFAVLAIRDAMTTAAQSARAAIANATP